MRATELFVSYEECRKYAQSKGIKSQREWQFHVLIRQVSKVSWNAELGKGIPKAPEAFYKKRGTWKNWGDFLGTNNQKNIKYMKFEEAKKFVSFFYDLKNSKQWFHYCKNMKKPKEIPCDLRSIYKKEWQGWSDFFGNDKTRKGRHMSFEQAREYVRNLKLKTREEFYDLKQRGLIPITIPRSPDKVYR